MSNLPPCPTLARKRRGFLYRRVPLVPPVPARKRNGLISRALGGAAAFARLDQTSAFVDTAPISSNKVHFFGAPRYQHSLKAANEGHQRLRNRFVENGGVLLPKLACYRRNNDTSSI
jgi:hypothetical protein